MQVSGKMAEDSETVKTPAEKESKPSKPVHEKDPAKEPKGMPEKEAPRAHEAPREHKVAQDKEAPREAARPAKAAPGGAKKKSPVTKAARPKVIGKSDIGIDVKPPAKACSDRNCPFHGRLPVRGQVFDGIVVSDGMDKSAVIRRERLVYVPKYERYLKRTSRMSVHSPPCIEAKVGDQVTVMECRPLSKTIAFTIVSKRADQKARSE